MIIRSKQQRQQQQHTDCNDMTIKRLAYDDQLVDTLARISLEHSRWAYERARAAALFLQQDQEQEDVKRLQTAAEANGISHICIYYDLESFDRTIRYV